MIKKYMIVLLGFLVSACVYQIERNDPIYKKYEITHINKEQAEIEADKLYAEDVTKYEEKELAKQEREKAQKLEDEKRQKEEAKKLAKLKKDFAKELADTKCYKEKWSRYEFGEYFQKIANRNNITAYDVVKGDQYTRRNIDYLFKEEIWDNYLKYTIYNFSETERTIYHGDESKKRELFNKIVKKDYNCYQKLK